MKVKFNFSNFFILISVILRLEIAVTRERKEVDTKILALFLFHGTQITVKIPMESVTMMYPDLPNLPGFLRKWLLILCEKYNCASKFNLLTMNAMCPLNLCISKTLPARSSDIKNSEWIWGPLTLDLPPAQICAHGIIPHIFHWRRSAPTRPCHDHAKPFLTSLRLPALPWPRLGVNGLGMSRATILESGVVIRFEFFELQPFKVDQFFRGFFRYFPTLITPKYIQK